jgi:nanoRNase/pAp phosphatase (c-di-AMP/oligoRNAs hydrolase)
MAYFRKVTQLPKLLDLFSKEERWLIVINADPDAMASALALKRIMAHRVADVGIARVNEITRPDNLEMIQSLRIPMRKLTPTVSAQFDRFAIVDSQPHHHPEFAGQDYYIVIDHHPASQDKPVSAAFVDIKPAYGAVSSLLTEYLYNLQIRPGMLLATALLYGIKTDTSSFERQFHDVDVRAFQYLTRFANQPLLRKIYRSEFKLEWLKYFPMVFRRMSFIGQGAFSFMGPIESPDILVVLADFFLRIQGVTWTVVGGQIDRTCVAIFRGDGLRKDMGRFATRLFGKIGTAGGHKSMARAEFPVEAAGGQELEAFLWNKLHISKPGRQAGRPKECPVEFGTPAPAPEWP